MWLSGIKPRIWAGVHIVHHSVTDANLYPALETANYLNWRQDHSPADHPDIPRYFAGLDPGAVLRPDQVTKLGSLTDLMVGGRYLKPIDYTKDEAKRLLDPVSKRYLYAPKAGKQANGLYDWEQPYLHPLSLMRLLPELRDPHSPVLHYLGIKGILRDNVPLYRSAARYMETQEAAGRDLGQDKWDRRLYDKAKFGVGAFYAGNIALKMATEGSLKPFSLLKGAVKGSLIAAGAEGFLIFGGNLTNSLGHAGDTSELARAILRDEIVMKPDGSYATDENWLGWVSADEAGRQEAHHDRPQDIAYTQAIGLQAIKEAPFGSLLSFAARHNLLMKPGKQYGLRDGNPIDTRPDIRTEAIIYLQQARVETRDKGLKLAAAA